MRECSFVTMINESSCLLASASFVSHKAQKVTDLRAVNAEPAVA